MEYLVALAPFLGIGIVAAIISRLTGIAISFLVVPSLLYQGATILEVLSFMLIFTLYTTLAIETDTERLDFKELTFFPGWKIAIPLIVSILLIFISPIASIGLFLFAFILELCALVYKRIPNQDKPKLSIVISNVIASGITCALGIVGARHLSADYYFLLIGLVMLALTAFAWYAGKNRFAFRSIWPQCWTLFPFFLGAFGLEISSYGKGLTRSFKNYIDYIIPICTIMAAFVGTMILFASENQFSLPSLITAIGCALGIRMAGTYEFTKQGGFPILAIGLSILVVLILYLVSPAPVGLPAILTTPF